MFDKGKVFLNLFYQKIKNLKNHEDDFEFRYLDDFEFICNN